jgi:hypothetical protein
VRHNFGAPAEDFDSVAPACALSVYRWVATAQHLLSADHCANVSFGPFHRGGAVSARKVVILEGSSVGAYLASIGQEESVGHLHSEGLIDRADTFFIVRLRNRNFRATLILSAKIPRGWVPSGRRSSEV